MSLVVELCHLESSDKRLLVLQALLLFFLQLLQSLHEHFLLVCSVRQTLISVHHLHETLILDLVK